MSEPEQGFHAGVEAMRAQVLAYLLDPQSGVGISTYATSAIVTEIRAMHPGYVKSQPLAVKRCACVSVDPDTCARIRFNRPGITGRRIDGATERDPCDCACHDPDMDEPYDMSGEP